MNQNLTDSPKTKIPKWSIPMIAIGFLLAIFSCGGLLLLPQIEEPPKSSIGSSLRPTLVDVEHSTEIAANIPPVITLIPTYAADGAIIDSPPEPEITIEAGEPTPVGTPIAWTEAEKNALSWLCWGEVRGMGEVRVDACLSVISTVRVRYAYSNGFAETDVVSTILRPNQFSITIDTAQPAPDSELYWIVEQYQHGLRGSCNGYLYFDSVPGGPSLCVIRASNGQYVEFHSGW